MKKECRTLLADGLLIFFKRDAFPGEHQVTSRRISRRISRPTVSSSSSNAARSRESIRSHLGEYLGEYLGRLRRSRLI